MSIVNKKVTAPISLWEVARLVRSTLLDLYTVCRSPYINKWSKVKPVRNSKYQALDETEFDGNTYQHQNGYRYGLKAKNEAGAQHNYIYDLSNIHEINWEYQRPDENSYSRLTDFDGYNHIAGHNPTVTYKLPTFYNKGEIKINISIDNNVFNAGGGINTFELYYPSVDTEAEVETLMEKAYPYVLIDNQLRAMKCRDTDTYAPIGALHSEYFVDLTNAPFTIGTQPSKISFFLLYDVPNAIVGSTLLVHKARDSWQNINDYRVPTLVGDVMVNKTNYGYESQYIIPLADATGLSKTFVDFDNCSAEAEYSFVTDGTNHYLRIDKVKFNGVEEKSVVASVSISNKFKSAVVWNMPVQLVTDYEISTPKLYKLSGRSALDTEKEYKIEATYNGVVTDDVIMTFNGFGDYNWDFNDDFWKQQFGAGEIADFNEDFNKDFKV